MWRELRPGSELIDQSWPNADEVAMTQDQVTLIVQVNGKLRGQISVASDATKEAIEQAALTNENAQKFISGQSIKKVIVVPKRLVNIVI